MLAKRKPKAKARRKLHVDRGWAIRWSKKTGGTWCMFTDYKAADGTTQPQDDLDTQANWIEVNLGCKALVVPVELRELPRRRRK